MGAVRVGVSVAALLAISASRAGADEAWKDGCPAKFPPESPPTSLSELPVHTGVGSFGALPEADSPLGPSRIAFTSWAGRIGQQEPAQSSPILLGGQLLIEVAATSGLFVMASVPAVESTFGTGGDTYRRWGNTQVDIGYRHASYMLGTAIRYGRALRLSGGDAPGADSAVDSVARRNEIAVISPFRESLFGFGRSIGITLETRIEMVGCHAPYVDLRADAVTWRPSDIVPRDSFPRVVTADAVLALGGYFLPRHAMFLEFAWEYRTPLTYSHFSRVSIGYELRPFDDWHLGIRAGAIAGANVTAWDVTATASWQFRWKGRFE